MTKLSDLQLILLTGASQRDDRSLLPLPDSLADQPKRVRPAIAGLLKRGLIEEHAGVPAAHAWRTEADQHYGIAITDQGLAAIGAVEPELDTSATPPAAAEPPAAVTPTPPAARAGSKQAQLIELLGRDGGVSITDLAEALGWLPHTTRAALTGLRKKGHVIDKRSHDGVTRYAIEPAA